MISKHAYFYIMVIWDSSSIDNLLHRILSDEVYNLAAMSHVRVSFDIPEYVSDIDGTGTLRILESIRKIEEKYNKKGAKAIKNNKQDCLYLGNIYTYRDFGHSKDFVRAMWLMLQQDTPEDYVIATGQKFLIKDIVNMVFEWRGEGENEYALANEKIVVRIDPKYFRPSEVESLSGDSTKEIKKLGWVPKYEFDNILNDMINNEI